MRNEAGFYGAELQNLYLVNKEKRKPAEPIEKYPPGRLVGE